MSSFRESWESCEGPLLREAGGTYSAPVSKRARISSSWEAVDGPSLPLGPASREAVDLGGSGA